VHCGKHLASERRFTGATNRRFACHGTNARFFPCAQCGRDIRSLAMPSDITALSIAAAYPTHAVDRPKMVARTGSQLRNALYKIGFHNQ
jgi:hypothetical protein